MNTNQIAQKLADFQKERTLPYDSIPDYCPLWVEKAMPYHNPALMKMSIAEWVAITEADVVDLTLWQWGAVLHMLEVRTPNEMGMEMEVYNSYIQDVEQMVKDWRAIVEPEQKRLQEELKAELEAQAEAKRKEMENAPAPGEVQEIQTPKGKVLSLVPNEIPTA